MIKKMVSGKKEMFNRKNALEIPSYIFTDRTLKPLEAIVEFLKEKKKLSYHEIALLLNRNDRTIWTVYDRSKKKRK